MSPHAHRTPFAIAAAFVAFCAVAYGQDQENDPAAPVPPSVVQEKLREWIQVKKTISAEQADWQRQQATLSDLNEIRKKEIARIDELITAAGSRLEDAEKQRADLTSEEQELRDKRGGLEERLIALEAGLRDRVGSFPQPLLVKIDDEVERLMKADPEVPLQNRFRDVIAILNEADTFENKITVETDLREIEGQQREIEVLYVGLHHAYYVDRTSSHAGTGAPGSDGWEWTANNKIAAEVRKAIAIHGRRITPDYVKLPMGGKETAE